MIAQNATAISVPVPDIRTRTHEFMGYTVDWIQTNWFQILIAAGVAAATVAALYALRGLRGKLCNPDRPPGSWISLIGTEVGRASGRERVWRNEKSLVMDGSLKKTMNYRKQK